MVNVSKNFSECSSRLTDKLPRREKPKRHETLNRTLRLPDPHGKHEHAAPYRRRVIKMGTSSAHSQLACSGLFANLAAHAHARSWHIATVVPRRSNYVRSWGYIYRSDSATMEWMPSPAGVPNGRRAWFVSHQRALLEETDTAGPLAPLGNAGSLDTPASTAVLTFRH
jgi:hypothetical protein